MGDPHAEDTHVHVPVSDYTDSIRMTDEPRGVFPYFVLGGSARQES